MYRQSLFRPIAVPRIRRVKPEVWPNGLRLPLNPTERNVVRAGGGSVRKSKIIPTILYRGRPYIVDKRNDNSVTGGTRQRRRKYLWIILCVGFVLTFVSRATTSITRMGTRTRCCSRRRRPFFHGYDGVFRSSYTRTGGTTKTKLDASKRERTTSKKNKRKR